MGQMRNWCKIVVKKPEGQKLLEDTRIDQRAVCNMGLHGTGDSGTSSIIRCYAATVLPTMR